MDEPFKIVIAGAKHTHVRDLTTILSICPIDPSLPANPLCLPHTPRSPTTDRINCTRTPMPVIFLTHSRPTSTARIGTIGKSRACACSRSKSEAIALHCRASGYRFGATMPPSAKVHKQHLKQEKKKPDTPSSKLHDSRKQMLGYLKYTGSDSKGATKEQKEQAQVALKVYEALPPNKKNAFIDRWKSTKDSKNMGWVRDFEETLSKQREVTRSHTQDLLTRQFRKQLHECVLACIALRI